MNKHLILIILDGWGISAEDAGNTIEMVRPQFYNSLLRDYPSTTISASGRDVGLPDGQMGNSEVGHLNIGAGRIVFQNLVKISEDIKQLKLQQNRVLVDTLKNCRGNLHLVGLVSDGGVHSHIDHLYALIKIAVEQLANNSKIFIHPILDGRDTPPKSALEYLEPLEQYCKKYGSRIATVSGRYYAMDRDNRWERTRQAFNNMVAASGRRCGSAVEAVKQSYAAGVNDEFMEPVTILENGSPVGITADGDSIIFFNFRADRARQLTKAFTENIEYFKKEAAPKLSGFTCMTPYGGGLDLPVLYPKENLRNILGEVLDRHGMTQLRIAETEKYAHVTYFFNGGVEKRNNGEKWILIPSPQDIATYDQKPAMSAPELTEKLLSELKDGEGDGAGDKKYNVVVINFANPDMVGHTGMIDAAREAVIAVDQSLKKIITFAKDHGWQFIVTADHGNVEQMRDINGEPYTAHTVNRVPFIVSVEDNGNDKGNGSGSSKLLRTDGKLADIAPTILEILEINKPEEMTGRSLFHNSANSSERA